MTSESTGLGATPDIQARQAACLPASSVTGVQTAFDVLGMPRATPTALPRRPSNAGASVRPPAYLPEVYRCFQSLPHFVRIMRNPNSPYPEIVQSIKGVISFANRHIIQWWFRRLNTSQYTHSGPSLSRDLDLGHIDSLSNFLIDLSILSSSLKQLTQLVFALRVTEDDDWILSSLADAVFKMAIELASEYNLTCSPEDADLVAKLENVEVKVTDTVLQATMAYVSNVPSRLGKYMRMDQVQRAYAFTSILPVQYRTALQEMFSRHQDVLDLLDFLCLTYPIHILEERLFDPFRPRPPVGSQEAVWLSDGQQIVLPCYPLPLAQGNQNNSV